MKVSFKNLKEQTFYEDFNVLRKKYGERTARKILDRIDDLLRAENPQKLPSSARFHEHEGKRSGLFSLDLVHPFRLIVKPNCEYATYREIISVEIYEVFNPHK